MMKLFFPLLLLSSYCATDDTIEREKMNTKVRLPLCVMYTKNAPPDSIQEFIKVYLRFKKIDIINIKDAIALYSGVLQSDITNAITSGSLENLTSAKASDMVMLKAPVANLLKIEIYSDTTKSDQLSIDSIQWYVDYLPSRNKHPETRMFFPSGENKINPFTILKSFSDTVLSSKLLK